MTPEITALLESLVLRLEAAASPEDMLTQAGELLAAKYAKTRHIKGGPSVEEQDGVYVLKGDLQPYNDAKLNSYIVVLRDFGGTAPTAEVRVYGSIPAKDAETSGFRQVGAKKTMSAVGLTAEKLAKILADLGKKAK